jgi:hypothetical protein
VVKDIKVENILSWNNFQGKSLADALPAIYDHATKTSKTSRDWYWGSIAKKKEYALLFLALTLILLIVGTILPVVAGIYRDEHKRLLCTQLGVVALAVAGLLQVCDRTFGLSSGWMRYIDAVTTMESLTRHFELDWAGYIVDKGAGLSDGDIKPLFEIAKQFEVGLAKVQSDETAKWASEFGSGLSALNELIKSQRESADKDRAAAKVDLETKTKLSQTGSLEVTFVQTVPPVALEIAIDDGPAIEVLGTSWATTNLSPGPHKVTLRPKAGGGPEKQKIATITAGGVASLEFK